MVSRSRSGSPRGRNTDTIKRDDAYSIDKRRDDHRDTSPGSRFMNPERQRRLDPADGRGRPFHQDDRSGRYDGRSHGQPGYNDGREHDNRPRYSDGHGRNDGRSDGRGGYSERRGNYDERNNNNNNDGRSYSNRRYYDDDRGNSDGRGYQQRQDSGQNRNSYEPRNDAAYFEERKRERDSKVVNIWPSSPEALPIRSPSPVHRKKRRNEPESSSEASTDSTVETSSVSSESESDHRSKPSRKKHKKESSRHKKKSKKKSKKRRSSEKSRKRSRRYDSDSDSDDSGSSDAQSDKQSASRRTEKAAREQRDEVELDEKARATIEDYWREKEVKHDEDAFVGPAPLPVTDVQLKEHDYGGALLAGEGSAMAAYVMSGKRIPRRGEIGLTSDEIQRFEDVGYVMSGSRHQRMNAVRIRKENQIISAEEKKALLMFTQEANLKKEAEIIGGFKELVSTRLKGKNRDE